MNKNKVLFFKEKIEKISPPGEVKIMEVCGTHTYAFYRYGLRALLPSSIRLISGPGCPVCVSETSFIDKAIFLARKGFSILSFGDLLRVPGSGGSLEDERAKGAEIRVLYSPLESLEIAQDEPEKRFIFLGVGFETTICAIAYTIMQTKTTSLKNLYFLLSLKLIPPVLKVLLEDKNLNIKGFILPGHVSTVIGSFSYKNLSPKMRGVISGFEPEDMMESIFLLLEMLRDKKEGIINQYKRAVRPEGNPQAKKIINSVLERSSGEWRGLGRISGSTLRLRNKFKELDAQIFLKDFRERELVSPCRCGDVLKGKIQPPDCHLFKKECSPSNPLGPCMVSFEGSCRIFYEYA